MKLDKVIIGQVLQVRPSLNTPDPVKPVVRSHFAGKKGEVVDVFAHSQAGVILRIDGLEVFFKAHEVQRP